MRRSAPSRRQCAIGSASRCSASSARSVRSLLKDDKRDRGAGAQDHEQALAEFADEKIEDGRRSEQKEHRLFERAQNDAEDAERRRLWLRVGAVLR